METLEGRVLLTAVVTGIPFAGVEAGSTGAISVASFTTSQPSPDPADYTATINWGDGASSSGSVSIVPNGRGGFDVVGYHTYAAVGTYGVGITVNSLYDATTASAVTTAMVSAASTISLDVWSMVTSGNVMTGQLSVATFTDSDPGSAPGIYTATIDWGDGTQSVGNVLAGGVGSVGDWRVQGAHLFAAAGHYTTWVTVSSIYGEWVTAGGDTTVQAFQSIAAVGTPVTGTQGTAATGTLATFTGSDPLAVAADYAATIFWGDGSTSSGTIVAGALGGWEVRGSHAYATPGSKTASVTITGGGGANASVSTTATIANPAMHGSGVNTSGLRAHTWTDLVAHFSDDNPMASAGDYAVTINWGDGQSSAGTVVANSGGGWDVIGTHAYAVPGTFAVATTITDGDGGAVTTTSTALPRNPRYLRYPLAGKGADVSVLRGRTFNGAVAVLTKPFPDYADGDFSGTIDWGDGSSSAATFVRTPAGAWTVNGTHVWATKGTYAVTVTLNDSLARTATVRTEATVLRPKRATRRT